ncbi:BTAD domain-containing putative transcriptional regulator [Actinoplanes sp. M2I2]|uniref:AfsR/SARP family transcriptional regulator n=1 Tax=Actinoplanes sp. M2I2 TaxID=1734444 RepID=UPI00202159EA|nr:BTAD domain-containing putative transcriptional regulator [Actinoplanes sp. M2I2]
MSEPRDLSGSLRLAVLGPVRAWRDGTEVVLGARQQRLLLALLVLRAGDVVASTEIVRLIWGDDPPPTAQNMVHAYIGSLRRLFEPGLRPRSNGRWLLREVGGYRFVPGDADIDLSRFREHLDRAGQLERSGAEPDALDLILAGVGQWHGRCATGLGADAEADPAFVAVEHEYVLAARAAARLALRCGRSADVLSLLREAAARYPLDESLHSDLLRVLAADGKQAEAIGLFGELRRRLAEELGVDPGPELKRAYTHVLRPPVAPPDEVAAPSPEAPPAIRPAQLPSDLSSFSGRDTCVREAVRLLRQTDRGLPVLAFDGMPGVGKTTLAIHVAHAAAADFPDGQLYVDLRGFDTPADSADPAEVLHGFLTAAGVAPTSVPAGVQARSSLLRSVLAGRRMLLVLDNARDADQVRPLLPGTAGNGVLVTSRRRLAGLAIGHGARLVRLEVPSVAEARAIFTGRIGAGRAAAEPAALDEIIQLCGRLPLALAIVAAGFAVQAGEPLAAIATELRRAPRTLSAISDVEPEQDLRAVFGSSYRLLSEAAARMFRLLPFSPGRHVTATVAAALTGESVAHARRHLHEISRTGLIEQFRPDHYRLHDLIRGYALDLGPGGDERTGREVTHRILGYYFRTAQVANRLVRPGYEPVPVPGCMLGVAAEPLPDEAAVMAWTAGERHALRTVIVEAAQRGDIRHAWQLALLTKDLFHRHGWWQDSATVLALVLEAAERAGDVEGAAQSRRGLAVAEHLLGNSDTAVHHLKIAYEEFGSYGDELGLGLVRMNLGYIAHQRGEHSAAVDDLTAALANFSRHGQRQLEAVVLATLAEAWLALGDEQRSARFAAQAARLCAELKDAWNEARAVGTLARIRRRNGRFVAAIRLHQYGIDLLRRRGSLLAAAEDTNELADTLQASGETDSARQVWTAVLDRLAGEPTTPPAIRAGQRLTQTG